MIKFSIALRKVRSAIFRLLVGFQTRWVIVRLRLMGVNIKIGAGVKLGRLVSIRTIDGGEITLGNHVTIESFSLLLASSGRLCIGDNTFIGAGCQIVASNSISIGKNGLIAAYSIIRDANHGIANGEPMYRQKQNIEPVNIGDDVWLGSHVVVTAGTNIGEGAVIGANAVVTHDISAQTVAVGVPAEYLRSKTSVLKLQQDLTASEIGRAIKAEEST